MTQFHYSGRDNTGALVSGHIDAGNADDVAAQLFGDSVTPIEIREVTARQIRPKKSTASTKPELGPDASTMDRLALRLQCVSRQQ